MTVSVTIEEVQARLAELLTLVAQGETVTILSGGKPVGEIRPPQPGTGAPQAPAKGGLDFEAGQRYLREHGIKEAFPYVAPDFDDPLPEDFLIRPLPE